MYRRPPRMLVITLAGLFLAACAGTAQTVRQSAEEAIRNTLAFHFSRRFGDAVQAVVDMLAAPGGYLDNPLVRILLPPPVGLVMDVARDLHADPRAALLETLMNRAAEHAVPGAGPVLRAVLQDVERADWQRVLTGDRTAATGLLRERAEASVREALRPAIEAKLAAEGAFEVYRGLLQDGEIEARIGALDERVLAEVPAVSAETLGDYVTERAVAGLFDSLARREATIREHLPPVPPPDSAPQDES